MEADCIEIFDTGRTLLATLGYPIFDAVAKPVESSAPIEQYYCKGSGADGRGLYTAEGFVVLKGSSGRKENVPSYIGTGGHRRRESLLKSGVMEVRGDSVVFTKDHLFSSSSMAAQALMGRTANGWLEWKTASGKTLDAVKRQTPPQ